MAEIGYVFDANQVAPSQAMEIMPKHWATATITDSEMKPTKAGDGAMLALTLTLSPGQQFSGRKVWTNLNLQNKSEKAMEIAFRDLSAICHATGQLQISNSNQLHGIPIDILVDANEATYKLDAHKQTIKDPQGNMIVEFKASNSIGGYAAAGTKATPGAGGAPKQAAAPMMQAPAMAQAPQYAPPPQQFAPPVQHQAPQQFAPPVQQAPAQQFAPPVQQAAPAPQFVAPVQQAPAAAAPVGGGNPPPWARPQ